MLDKIMKTTETTELGFNTPIAVPKRPDRRSKEVLVEAAKALAKDLKDYFKNDNDDPYMDEDEAYNIAYACVDHYDHDGYKLVKLLDDRYSIEGDSDLVDVLDGTWYIVSKAEAKATEKWVKDHNVTVPYSIGDKVKFKKPPFKESIIEGTVKTINSQWARLTVKSDTCSDPSVIGTVINVEDVL